MGHGAMGAQPKASASVDNRKDLPVAVLTPVIEPGGQDHHSAVLLVLRRHCEKGE